MKKKAALNIFFSVIFIIIGSNIYAQDSTKTIILSENIGPIVDIEEKQKYNILPIFQESFRSAVFMVTPNNAYFCNVTLKDGKTLKDTIIFLGYHSVRNLAFRIYNLELLEKGYSEIDINSFEFQYSEQKSINSNNIANKDSFSNSKTITVSSDLLPIQRNKINYSEFIESKYKIGFSIGIFYNNTNFDGLNEIYNLAEKNIPIYVISKSQTELIISPIYKLSSFVIFKNEFMLEMEYLFNINLAETVYIDYENFALSFNYLFPLKTDINAYAGIGYSSINFTAYKKYNVSGIESISLVGADVGIKVALGMKYKISNLASLDFSGRYNIFPKIGVNQKGSEVSFVIPKTDLNGFELGLSFYININ